MRRAVKLFAVAGLLWFASTAVSWGRAEFAGPGDRGYRSLAAQQLEVPLCVASHRINQMVLAINNNGTFGTGFTLGSSGDCFTGDEVNSCEYPKGSNSIYLFSACFWIGAVIGRDTVVSLGADGWSFNRELFPFRQPMIRRSIIDPEDPEYEGAISEEDFIATYTDTFTEGIPADLFGQPHIPIRMAITENSYGWSYGYAEDFILFDYQIRSMNDQVINNLYLGIYCDADVYVPGAGDYSDDITGFMETYDRKVGTCVYEDTVNIAWLADNDGDLDLARSVPHVTGMRIVRTPQDTLQVSYNWWFSASGELDFGPRERPLTGRLKENWRDFGTGGTGTPEGDRNKYYIMSNREFDYDQARVASIGPNDPLWIYPKQELVEEWATGADTRYLLSFGPFQIRPGQTLPLSFAYVGGKDLHSKLDNLDNLPYNYTAFYENLSFDDFAENARWASWIYDNPGVDTDSDGYRGAYHLCPIDSVLNDTIWTFTEYDTLWYIGDGIPDFRGAAPPPAPEFWLTPSRSKIHIRFNGTRSQTTRDVFTNEVDFEGYRVYIARDSRETSFSVICSYDRENYLQYEWIPKRKLWQISPKPFTRQELACLYGDSCNDPLFDPLIYTRLSPLQGSEGTLYYFMPQDHNRSELGTPGQIRKVYPDQPKPTTTNPRLAYSEELTPDGLFKYYEYEYEIEGLLPSVPYYVNVTAFDFGSPASGLPALESSVTQGAKYVIPGSNPDEVQEENPAVIVYPNPYRVDGGYRDIGFEGRVDFDRPDHRVRRVHFANLPPRCTIRIFTVDGDLVKTIEHNMSPDDPNSSYDEWDLITRNTQMVVSGLYYWTVEADGRETQIGKLAIIM